MYAIYEVNNSSS